MCAGHELGDGGDGLALAACATAPIETARTVPGDPAAVRVRLEAELTDSDSPLGVGRAPNTSLGGHGGLRIDAANSAFNRAYAVLVR